MATGLTPAQKLRLAQKLNGFKRGTQRSKAIKVAQAVDNAIKKGELVIGRGQKPVPIMGFGDTGDIVIYDDPKVAATHYTMITLYMVAGKAPLLNGEPASIVDMGISYILTECGLSAGNAALATKPGIRRNSTADVSATTGTVDSELSMLLTGAAILVLLSLSGSLTEENIERFTNRARAISDQLGGVISPEDLVGMYSKGDLVKQSKILSREHRAISLKLIRNILLSSPTSHVGTMLQDLAKMLFKHGKITSYNFCRMMLEDTGNAIFSSPVILTEAARFQAMWDSYIILCSQKNPPMGFEYTAICYPDESSVLFQKEKIQNLLAATNAWVRATGLVKEDSFYQAGGDMATMGKGLIKSLVSKTIGTKAVYGLEQQRVLQMMGINPSDAAKTYTKIKSTS